MMKNLRRVMGSVLFLFVLSACASQAATPVVVPTITPTAAIPTERACQSLPGECPAWSPAAPASEGRITAANVDQLSAPAELSNFPVHASSWSADARRLALTGPAGIVVYAVNPWQLLLAIDTQGYPTFGLALSPDGKTLAYSPGYNPNKSIEQVVHLVDIDSGRERTSLKGHEKAIWHIAFSADGSRLATNSDDSQIWIWDVQAGAVIKKFTDQPAQATLTFSPDGKSLLVESIFGAPFVLDLQTGAKWMLGPKSNGYPPHVYSAAFSPDGRTLLVGADDHQLHQWDVASQKEVGAWAAHADAVAGVAFAPDGRLIASSSLDGTIKFWDAATNKLLTTLTQVGSASTLPVESVMFSPDGQFLMASFGKQLTLKVWGVKP